MSLDLHSKQAEILRSVLRLMFYRYGDQLTQDDRELVLGGFVAIGTAEEVESAEDALRRLRASRAAQLQLREIIEQLPPLKPALHDDTAGKGNGDGKGESR